MKQIPWTSIFSILLVPSLLLNIYLYTTHERQSPGVEVAGVIDGDTIVLSGGKQRVRLRYADAPELENCGGKVAKQHLETLVSGKEVKIEQQVPDRYGRSMALVYIGDTLINKEMLRSGWSRYHHDTSPVTEEMKAARDEAQKNNSGVYGLCQSKTNTKNPSCVIKANIDKNSVARLYYLPGCAQYNFTVVEEDTGESWFCTEKEAESAGFTKAATCK